MSTSQNQVLKLVVRRPLVTMAVEQARAELVNAFKEACLQSGLTRDEAEGKLSLFITYLWDDLEPVVRRLPRLQLGCVSRHGLNPDRKPRAKRAEQRVKRPTRGRPPKAESRKTL
jgi:hypothetical protein